MKTWIKALGIAGLLTSAVALADAVIFSGNDVKTLKPNIDLYGQSKILSGSVDPTSSAQSAPVGSIYLNTSNGNLYRKVDAGSSTNWQKVGSAAVAGNLLPNPDWETSSSGWTASAGTYARTTTAANVGFGAGSGSWDASASSQTLTSTAVAIPTGLYAANGLARCYFKTTATDYVLQAYDGTNVLASATIPASTQYQQYGVNFPFPSSGSVSLRVVSASDAAVIYMDDCYVGPAANLQSVNQASLVGSAYFSPTVGCTWARTNTALGAFGTTAACPAPTIQQNVGPGQIQTTDADLPQITINNLPPGEYQVVATFSPAYGTSASNLQFAINDGTTTSGHVSMRDSVSGNEFYPPTVVGTFSYSTAGNRTFAIHAAADTGSVVINADTLNRRLNFTILRFPSTSELAYRPDQVAWRVDANISGANFDLGLSNQTSYIEMTNGSMTLTQNAGSIATQIACASGAASSGTTCTAANESNGISFTAPSAGAVLACVSFTHSTAQNAASSVEAIFQIIETTNTSSAIVQEGKSRIDSLPIEATSSFAYGFQPLRLCGTFEFSSAGQKTLRLAYEQGITGAVTQNRVLADANANLGQRDIHWEVYPITQSIPAPLLVGSVTSSSTGLERVERIRVGSACASSPCTITSQSGSWVNSVTRLGTGQYRLEIASGIFSQIPTCMCVTDDGATNLSRIVCEPSTTAGARSTTQYSFFTLTSTTGSNQDASFQLMCMGPR